MKTKVFSKKENKFKEVKITDPDKPEINDEIIVKWQNIANIIANIIEISAGLIIKITPETMEIFLKSENENNPYETEFNASLGNGLYCETVIVQNKELYIKNSLCNEDFKDNLNLDIDMVSYFGLPIKWPDGEFFGTICILDDKTMDLDKKSKKLLEEFRNVIEDDLKSLIEQQKFKNFFDINLDLLCIADTDGNFIEVNNAWSNLLGYSKSRLENMRFLDFIHPDDLDSTLNAIKNLKNDQKAVEFINRYKGKDDKYHYIEWNSKLKGDYIYAAARDITDKVVQNQRLKQQKNKLDLVIEGTDAATWEWNVQTGETIFSDKWAKMLGYELEELEPTTEETWKNLIHPNDFKKAEKKLEKHFRGEIDHYEIEFRMKHKNGNWVWINGRGRVTSWTEDNSPLKMFGIHIDITERKKKEEKLRLSEEKFRSYFESSPTGIFITDENGYYIDVNKSACKLLGYKKNELVGKNILDIASSDIENDHLNKFKKLQETGSLRVELKILTKNNESKFVRLNAIKLKNGENLGFVEDLTELNKEHNKTNKILETAIDGFFMADEIGKIIDINQAFEDILGYSRDEIIGKKITYFESRENRYEVKEHIEHIKANGSDRFETIYINKAGEKINIEASVTYLNLDNQTNLFFAFVRDITERKKNQKEIKKIKERLELAVEGGNIGIWDWNIKTGEAYFNKNWFNMIGYKKGELDYNVKSWENLIHPDDKSKVKREINKFLNGKIDRYITEHRVKTKNGSFKWIKDIGKVIKTGKNGKPLRAVGIHLDIDKEKRSKKQVEYLSYHDSLTDLYNYRYLMEEIDRMSNSRSYPISIVIGDLDRLKFINDNFGHKKGDKYIKRAADILKKSFRNEDVISRIGGDEFAVVLPNTNNNESRKIIDRVKNQFKIIRENNEEYKFLNISLGISTMENSSTSFKQVYKKADKNMYKDKKNKRKK